MTTIFILLVIYQLKHFICDYPLQTSYMLGKFKGGNEWILPLGTHCLVHGIATFIIALFFNPKVAVLVTAVDIFLHFIMDRIKASPNMLGRFKTLTKEEYVYIQSILNNIIELNSNKKIARDRLKSNTLFWYSLGLDQMVHHLTHYVIIWMLIA